LRERDFTSRAFLWLTLVFAAAILFSCDAWNGGEVGLAPPPAAPWSGVEQFGTAAFDLPAGVATDPSGNVYVASMDGQSAVVRKFTSGGSLSWTSTVGAGTGVLVRSIAVSPTAVYVSGDTSVVLDNTGLGMGGGVDGFVVKYSFSGVKTGALQIRESVGATAPSDVAVDISDHVYVGGYIDSVQLFVTKYDWSGASPSRSWITQYATLAPAITSSVFRIALGNGLLHVTGPVGAPPTFGFYINRFSTSTGAQSGATILGNVSGGNDSIFAVAADALNNTYVAGGTDNNFGGVNAGVGDVIAAKYDAAGANVWRYQIGSARNETANSITLSGTSVYVAGTTGGQFGGQLNKDPGLSTSDAFLIKLPNSSTGPTVTADWVRMYGSTNGLSVSFNDQASGIATDPSGNVFVVGNAVGFMESATQILGNGDVFVLKVSAAGVLQ
jgi:hypothetical protein